MSDAAGDDGPTRGDDVLVRIAEDVDVGAIERFLIAEVDTALFLLAGLARFGHTATGHPLSGDFYVVESEAAIVAVYCLTLRGELLIQASATSPDEVWNLVVEQIASAGRLATGVIAELATAEAIWSRLSERWALRPTYHAKQRAYRKAIGTAEPSPTHRMKDVPRVELITVAEYDLWDQLYIEQMREEWAPAPGTRDERFAKNRHLLESGWVLGVRTGDELAGSVVLNAHCHGFGQVAGLYVRPAHRRQGLASVLMAALIDHCRSHVGLHTLILHVNQTNQPARRLYEAIGFSTEREAAFLFGVPPPTQRAPES